MAMMTVVPLTKRVSPWAIYRNGAKKELFQSSDLEITVDSSSDTTAKE